MSPHWRQLGGVALLAIHIFGHPVDKLEPIPCDDLVALNKLLIESSLEEVKEVLG